VLNRMTRLGMPVSLRTASTTATAAAPRPSADLCTCIREWHGGCECKLAVRAGLPGATLCALVP
jgi:hypothetical protein